MRVARYLWDEKLALMAKVFPRVRKPMHTHIGERVPKLAGASGKTVGGKAYNFGVRCGLLESKSICYPAATFRENCLREKDGLAD